MNERLPFNADKVSVPSDELSPARRERRRHAHIGDARPLAVSELASLIKTTLEERIHAPLKVVGEVSNLSARNHWYFSLKDADAVIGCVAWASAAKSFGFTPEDGDEVVATGHLSFYGPQGRVQLYVSKLEPVGAGALEIAFRKMCEQLRAEGYFDPSAKQDLPAIPRRVAVITSAKGAALQDVISTAAQRWKGVALTVVDVRVQGDGAAAEIARAIRWVDSVADARGFDAVLVTRGGGSIEDLWAFNERIVAEAAYECDLPLVAAIGHESDTTIIELVADQRAATPTQAAMMLVPDRDGLARQLEHVGGRLELLVRQRLDQATMRLRQASLRPWFERPAALLQPARGRISELQQRLHRAVSTVVRRERHRVGLLGRVFQTERQHRTLESARRTLGHVSLALKECWERRVERERLLLRSLQRQFHAIDPKLILQRGYSLTTGADGTILRSVNDVDAGSRIVTHLGDGEIDSTVHGQERGLDRGIEGQRVVVRSKKRAKNASSKASDASQLDLFDAGE